MTRHEISDPQVMWILADPGDNAVEIGARFGVTGQTVRQYKALKIQRAKVMAEWLQAQGVELHLWTDGPRRGMFTDAQIREIRAGTTGDSIKLAKQYGCSPALIRMIRLGKAYANVGEE